MHRKQSVALVANGPRLGLVRGDLDRIEHINGMHRDIREWVSTAINARKRNQGPRPVRRLYDVAEGTREPGGPLLKHIEGIAALRDHAAQGDLWLYDTAIKGIALRIHEEADHALWASDQRRAQLRASKPEGAA